MRHLYKILILGIFGCFGMMAQTKKGHQDSTFRSPLMQDLQETLALKDFKTSADAFNFRFVNTSQLVEITKDSSGFHGMIVHFVYHTKHTYGAQMTLLTATETLAPSVAEKVYHRVQASKVLEIPSSQALDQWLSVADGTFYTIAYATPQDYGYQTYGSPEAQQDLPEALIVLDFVNALEDLLGLSEAHAAFSKGLPQRGCYHWGGSTRCIISNPLSLGYSGAGQLPFGFYGAYWASFIGKAKIDSGIALQYNFDGHGLYHMNLQASQANIFYKTPAHSDVMVYNYQHRQLQLDEEVRSFKNHQLKYALHLKHQISLGAGMDYITGPTNQLGAHFYASHAISSMGWRSTWMGSFFGQQFNYSLALQQWFHLRVKGPVRSLALGLVYEDFMAYKDVYFRVTFGF